MVIFGVRLVCACTNLKCSIIGWPENPSLPVTRTPSLRVVTPANAMPVSMTWRSTPSRPQRKSRCHQERRNSPSVTACSPTSSCFLITRSISRSSSALSSAAPRPALAASPPPRLRGRGPQGAPHGMGADWGFASFHACPSLAVIIPPLWPASPPPLTRPPHDPPQLRPLLVLGQDIAFLARG